MHLYEQELNQWLLQDKGGKGEQVEVSVIKRQRKFVGADEGYIHYLDCSDYFTGA